MDAKEAFTQLLTKNQRLLHGALKKCQIDRNNPDYEDYLQIARIAFYEAYQKFQQLPLSTEKTATKSPLDFNGFAYRSICWALRDAQRKNWLYQKQQATGDLETVLAFTQDATPDFAESLAYQTWLQKIRPLLTDKQQIFLQLYLEKGYTISEIAKILALSRQTLYQWRNQLGLLYLKYMQPENAE